MQIDLFDAYPYRPLEPALRLLLARAHRVDAAIAFVAHSGVLFFRDFLCAEPKGGGRLVASVRFPTNLIDLMNLEEDFPGTVFLHTGFKTPCEKDGERGQFHSKIVLVELDGSERAIIVGSHNWTENALQGHNLKASVIISCREADPIVREVREHIEGCVGRSEPFSPKRLRFYQAVQRDLEKGTGPGGQENEDFPGFQEEAALVIHAEDTTSDGLPSPMRLFIPIQDPAARPMFAETPRARLRVLLYVYPAGTLLGKQTPTAAPAEFEGSVTMQNDVPDAAVTARPANCQIGGLAAPRIELLESGSVPVTTGEVLQVAIRCDWKGNNDLPIFHAADQQPKMRLGVEYEEVDREQGATHVGKVVGGEGGSEATVTPQALPTYQAPRRLTVRTRLRVPSQDLYRDDIQPTLRYLLMGTDFFDQSIVPELELESPSDDRVLNRYVYRVNYRLSKETIARVAKQLRLFR